jgi:hypothetical protein
MCHVHGALLRELGRLLRVPRAAANEAGGGLARGLAPPAQPPDVRIAPGRYGDLAARFPLDREREVEPGPTLSLGASLDAGAVGTYEASECGVRKLLGREVSSKRARPRHAAILSSSDDYVKPGVAQ